MVDWRKYLWVSQVLTPCPTAHAALRALPMSTSCHASSVSAGIESIPNFLYQFLCDGPRNSRFAPSHSHLHHPLKPQPFSPNVQARDAFDTPPAMGGRMNLVPSVGPTLLRRLPQSPESMEQSCLQRTYEPPAVAKHTTRLSLRAGRTTASRRPPSESVPRRAP